MSGRKLKFKTTIIINKEAYKPIEVDSEIEKMAVEKWGRKSDGNANVTESTENEDGAAEGVDVFEVQNFNGLAGARVKPTTLKKYVVDVNAEYKLVKDENYMLKKELECRKKELESSISLEDHHKRIKREQGKRGGTTMRKKKRNCAEDGGFVISQSSTGKPRNQQKQKAVSKVQEVIDDVADTPQKQKQLMEAIGQGLANDHKTLIAIGN